MEFNEKLLTFEETKDSQGQDYFIMHVNRPLLRTDGFQAVS